MRGRKLTGWQCYGFVKMGVESCSCASGVCNIYGRICGQGFGYAHPDKCSAKLNLTGGQKEFFK